MAFPSVPIRLGVEPRRGVCPGCGAPVAWYQTSAGRWEWFDGAAILVAEFEAYTPCQGGPEARPEVGYISEASRHREECQRVVWPLMLAM